MFKMANLESRWKVLSTRDTNIAFQRCYTRTSRNTRKDTRFFLLESGGDFDFWVFYNTCTASQIFMWMSKLLNSHYMYVAVILIIYCTDRVMNGFCPSLWSFTPTNDRLSVKNRHWYFRHARLYEQYSWFVYVIVVSNESLYFLYIFNFEINH